MSLQLSLKIVLVVEDDTLIGYGHEYFFAGLVGEIVDSIIDMIVES